MSIIESSHKNWGDTANSKFFTKENSLWCNAYFGPLIF